MQLKKDFKFRWIDHIKIDLLQQVIILNLLEKLNLNGGFEGNEETINLIKHFIEFEEMKLYLSK